MNYFDIFEQTAGGLDDGHGLDYEVSTACPVMSRIYTDSVSFSTATGLGNINDSYKTIFLDSRSSFDVRGRGWFRIQETEKFGSYMKCKCKGNARRGGTYV